MLRPPDETVRMSSIQVRGLTEALSDAGVSATAFVERVRLDRSFLSDSNGWMALDAFDALVEQAVAFAGDPAFGLHWGERSPMAQFDLAPALVATASTLREAIHALLRFLPVVVTRPELELREEGRRALLVCHLAARSETATRVRSELALTGLWRLLRYWNAKDALRCVSFMHARPSYGAEYERLFDRRARFEQPVYALEFARTALDLRSPHCDGELHQLVRERTERLRRRALGELSHAQRVESLIRNGLPRMLSFAEVARELELSERSLRRRLQRECVSYSDVADGVLRERAAELLAQGNKSVKEVAHALGFDSVSGFHRAYRRWNGNSPARARQA